VLALLFIFLVLAAQFESFVDPFVILLAVPLSMVGALGRMHLTGGTLNVYSQIGLITLVGLITKHGILIVEFSNQLRQQGRPRDGSRDRGFQPAPAPDPDDHRRHGAGRHAAGLARRRRREPAADRLGDRGWHELGTLLTIFVVPTIYTPVRRARGDPVAAVGVAWFGNDAGVVAAAGQQEGDLGVARWWCSL
jgi:multidrug efflux pump